MTSEADDPRRVITACVPVLVETPDRMAAPVAEVLAGEYESGWFGEALTILDVGANVGSFSLWADLRWPRSVIHAYEPHPGTFAILTRNLAGRPNIHAVNAAIYPTEAGQVSFFGRYDGDGEAGVAACMTATFSQVGADQIFETPAMHPRELPSADVIKLDVEGAEADILAHMDLEDVSLILLEYQNDASRAAIKARLAQSFTLEFEDEFPWDDILAYDAYRPDLAGDHWGRMFFASRRPGKLRRLAPPRSGAASAASQTPARLLTWREILAAGLARLGG